jgi:hypothetical protein
LRKHGVADTAKVTKRTISVEVSYSDAFRRAVSAARVRAGVPAVGDYAGAYDAFDVFGGYDSAVDYYDGYDSYDEGGECSIM